MTNIKPVKYTIKNIQSVDGGVKRFDMDVMPEELANYANDMNYAINTAESAQSTAESAQSTANTAKSTAESAQSTANTAKSTAESAQSTANTAKSTAESAQSTAESAQSTANTAKSTAESAQSTATGAYRRTGENVLALTGNGTGISGNMNFRGSADNPIYCCVDRASTSDIHAPARFVFKANGATKMQVEGIDVLQMKSTGGKTFNLTVDDSGTLSATEVT